MARHDRKSLRPAGLALCAALAGIGLAPPVMAQQVGAVGAVNPASQAVSRGSVRVLELGAPIIHDEHLRTSAAGSLQVVFVDKTTLSIGPSSEVTIDSFVYDPLRGTGSMAATLAKGVLRIVGGSVTHTGGATVSTPFATIGLRGGIATVSHSPRFGTQAVDGFGTLTVASKGLPGRAAQ